MRVVGVDEVGRGCWAGPLVAAAVLLKDPIPGLNDSKKLSAKKRILLDQLIRENAEFGIGWVLATEVDALGLTAAVRTAMHRAIAQLKNYDTVIVDGGYNFLSGIDNSYAIIRADGTVPAVSAASIVAKVARDAFMQNEADEQYPQYGFARHVGYGTSFHAQQLSLHGPCVLHRMTYKPVQTLGLQK